MDSVPKLFIESVCALVSNESLEAFKGCRSAVWRKKAKEIWRKTRKMLIDVNVLEESNPPAYRYVIAGRCSLDDLRRERYTRIIMYIGSEDQDTKKSTNIDGLKPLFAYVSTRHVEELNMSSVHRFDSLFQNFFPLSVNSIIIWRCTFGANSAFPQWLRRTLRMNSLQELNIIEWLRRTLRSNPLQELNIKRTTVEGRKEDVEEDLIHQSLMHGKHLKICMDSNHNFTNLDSTFLGRVLELWKNSEKPLPRQIRYHFPCYYREEQIRHYLNDVEGKTLVHKSGSGTMSWTYNPLELTFTP
uniref:F-box domain-containing protein n=1 Tax=Steinernema glaseri TaxID=37863 RepID=A0A1I7YYM3_9BILA